MIGGLDDRVLLSVVPNEEKVVIASGGQLNIIGRPLQPTNFLFMSFKGLFRVFRRSRIPNKDSLIPGASSQRPFRPGHAAYPPILSLESSHSLLLLYIKYFYQPPCMAEGQLPTVRAPFQGANRVVVRNLQQPTGLPFKRTPFIHIGSERHHHTVGIYPVENIQVEIVLEAWGVQDFVRDCRYFSDNSLLFGLRIL